jgi:hypothetical protein
MKLMDDGQGVSMHVGLRNPGMFEATYSDWKVLKTRGVIAITFEVPIEAEGLAYTALQGMPNSAEEKWFVIARHPASAALRPTAGDGEDGTSCDPPRPLRYSGL